MEVVHERFVVPVAGTTADDRVLAVVANLTPPKGGSITLLYVVAVAQAMPLDAELPAQIAAGDTALRHAETRVRQLLGPRKCQLHTELLQARSVGAAVVDEAIERSADAIVMASSIRRKHGRPTVGDTVQYVLLNAPCEVIAIRLAPDTGEPGEVSWR